MFDNAPEEYKRLSSEVSVLKSDLNKINSDKESWFRKKEDLKLEINDLVKKIKDIKSESDKKNIEIKELKKQRDRYNNEVHSLIKSIKKLNKEKQTALEKYNIKLDPSKIQEKINILENKVEIEVDFEKEKKYMEEIKKLKKVFGESSEIMKLSLKADELAKEIKESRAKADEFHRKIQEAAKDANYESFMELSSKISVLRKNQEDAFQNFIESKDKYSKFYSEFKPKSERLEMLRMVFRNDREVQNVVKEQRNEQIIEKRSVAVEQKLKTGKRITTEDLLSIQGDIAD